VRLLVRRRPRPPTHGFALHLHHHKPRLLPRPNNFSFDPLTSHPPTATLVSASLSHPVYLPYCIVNTLQTLPRPKARIVLLRPSLSITPPFRHKTDLALNQLDTPGRLPVSWNLNANHSLPETPVFVDCREPPAPRNSHPPPLPTNIPCDAIPTSIFRPMLLAKTESAGLDRCGGI
jgi:hypothetical protein